MKIFIVILILVSFLFILINPYAIGHYFNKIAPKNPEFIETDKEWCKLLRENYTIIRDEYMNSPNGALKRFSEIDPYQLSVDDNVPWGVVILRLYNKNTKNTKYFPKTLELISKVPNCSTIMFSVLSPGQYIKPHVGPYKGVLRYHLGLITPENVDQCYLHVNNIKYSWKAGQDVLFDDTYIHSVNNNTDESRVVLFLDVKKNFDSIVLNCINSFLLFFVKYNKDISRMVDKT